MQGIPFTHKIPNPNLLYCEDSIAALLFWLDFYETAKSHLKRLINCRPVECIYGAMLQM